MKNTSRSRKHQNSKVRGRRHRKTRKFMLEQAKEHLDTLFKALDHPHLKRTPDAILKEARKLYRGSGIGFGKDLEYRGWKVLVCPKCEILLQPGKTCRVRLQKGRTHHLVVTCLVCKHSSRIPIEENQEPLKAKLDGGKTDTTIQA